MSTAALALLAALAAVLLAASWRRSCSAPAAPPIGGSTQGLLAIGERMDDARRRARRRPSSGCAKTPLRTASSSRSGRRSTSTRCSPAAPRPRPRCHGVAGATVAVDLDGVPLTAAAGLATGAAERRDVGAVGGPPDGSRVRAVGISYHYPRRTATGVPAIRSAIAIPLEDRRRASRLPDRVRLQRGPAGDGQRLPDARGDRRHTGPRSRWRAAPRRASPMLERRPADRARQPPGCSTRRLRSRSRGHIGTASGWRSAASTSTTSS